MPRPRSTIRDGAGDEAADLWIAGRADHSLLAVALAESFHDGDLARWLVPDPHERAAIYPGYFGLLLDGFLARPSVRIEVAGSFHGVAIWVDVTTRFSLPIPDYERRLAASCDPHTDRFAALDAAMEHRHPFGPHEYLAYLAVVPKHHGQGIGSLLLRHRLTRLDAAGRTAYLEATGDRNVALYQRHGFRELASIPIGDEVALRPMYREPNPDLRDPPRNRRGPS
ncbi:GNAT family N-acetyltransferase [Dactylosporangium sp. NPDC051485]|uniref:GNAT family N-acetyltransferase n=1 Tax=Dactylosporangium sp. NPDC051485 TaxID=3154846 RepID=UPI00341A78A8